MTVASKIAGLIEALSREPDAFDSMLPAERRRLADVCRYVADKAEPKADAPKSGVLSALRNGHRSE